MADPEGSEASKFTFAASNDKDSKALGFVLEDPNTIKHDNDGGPKSYWMALFLSICLGVFGFDWVYLSCGNTRYVYRPKIHH